MRKTIVSALGGVAIFAGAAAADSIPERLMADLQADLQLTATQAAGVVGNLARETGNFRYIVEIEPVVKGSRGGVGYSQWTGSRHDDLIQWAEEGSDFSGYDVNYGFILYELQGEFAYALRRLKQTETVEEATLSFMENYLMPHKDYLHLSERMNYAKAYFDGDFSGSGCQKWHHLSVDGRLHVVATCDEILAMNDAIEEEHIAAVPAEDLQQEFDVEYLADLALLDEIVTAGNLREYIPGDFFAFQSNVALITGCTVDPFAPTVCQEALLDRIIDKTNAKGNCPPDARPEGEGFCL